LRMSLRTASCLNRKYSHFFLMLDDTSLPKINPFLELD
jgi:hypothetical protein